MGNHNYTRTYSRTRCTVDTRLCEVGEDERRKRQHRAMVDEKRMSEILSAFADEFNRALRQALDELTKAIAEAIKEMPYPLAEAMREACEIIEESRKEPEGREVFRRIYADDAGYYKQRSEVRPHKEVRNQHRDCCIRRIPEKKVALRSSVHAAS